MSEYLTKTDLKKIMKAYKEMRETPAILVGNCDLASDAQERFFKMWSDMALKYGKDGNQWGFNSKTGELVQK